MKIKFIYCLNLTRKGLLKVIMKSFIFLLCTTAFSFTSNDIFSQNVKIQIEKDQELSIDAVFDLLRDQTDYTFIYREDLFKDAPKLHLKKGTVRANDLLKACFSKTDFNLILEGNKIIITENNSSGSPSQSFEVAGTVKDNKGTPLPGANILEKGTTNGTQTDFDGNFTLELTSENATLEISYIGFATKEISVNGQDNFDVVLEESADGLDEVVVVGYGSIKKSDLTGSVASVTSEELTEQPNNNLISALQGRAAGVQVSTGDGSPGGGINIRIRGTSTITGSTEPLYIIDGFPVSSANSDINIGGGIGETSSEGVASNVFPNALSMINPANIESVEILKDAAATAIYGSRGANGVVIITTKRGDEGKSSINLNISASSATLANKLDRLEGNLQAQISNDFEIANGANPANVRWNGSDKYHPVPGNAQSYDWQDIIYRQATTHNVSLTMNGGNKNAKYLISGNVVDQEGIMRKTSFSDYRFRTNLDLNFGSLISVNSSVLLSHSVRQQAPGASSGFGYNVVTQTLSMPGLINPEWRDPNNPDVWYVDPKTAGGNGSSNPLKVLQDVDDQLKRNRLLGNLSATLNITDGLKLTGNAGIDYSDGERKIYQKSTLTFNNSVVNGNAVLNTNTLIRKNFNAYLTWNKKIGDHNVDMVAGAENTRTGISYVNLSASNFSTDELGAESFQVGDQATYDINNHTNPDLVLVGFFGRLNYNFNNKYYLSVNARRDGSSVFGTNEKWGFFPSAALAWRVSQESFFSNVKEVLSDFKLRASVGQTGNGNLTPGSSVGIWTVQSNRYSFADIPVNGISLSRISNDELKWESTTQYNIGFDAKFIKNRFGLSVDYYIKDTKDLILPVVIPITTGYTSSIQNLGSLQSSGLEFTVNAVVLDKGDFKWDFSGNLSFQKMEATEVEQGTNIDLRTGQPYIEVFAFPRRNGPRLYEGSPAGQIYGYKVGGVFADQAEADAAPTQIVGNIEGYRWYEDIDGNGSIGLEDQVALGKITPDYIFGFNNRFAYKNFELSLFFQGVQGNSIISYYAGDELDPRKINYWTPENRNTNIPRNSSPNGELVSTAITSEDVQDGSYIRLKNVRLAYNLPRFKSIGSLTIFLTGTNLWTGTKYRGYNPDVSAGGSTPFSEGFDTGIYPLAKEITLGLNFNL